VPVLPPLRHRQSLRPLTDASLRQMSIDSLRKPLGDRRENFHCFSAPLLTLQTKNKRTRIQSSDDPNGLHIGRLQALRSCAIWTEVMLSYVFVCRVRSGR